MAVDVPDVFASIYIGLAVAIDRCTKHRLVVARAFKAKANVVCIFGEAAFLPC